MKVIFDASPMIVEQTGIAFYTERLVVGLAQKYPEDIELRGFYYNFLGRRSTAHMPRLKNLDYMGASVIPSKIVYQLRRWGIEVPIEALSLAKADFILYPNILGYPSIFRTPSAPVIHDLTYIDLPEYVSARLRSDLIEFVPKQIKRSKFIITVSEFTKQRIVDYYGVAADRIVVTPIPPEAPIVHDSTRREALLRSLGIFKPFILFVGTIEPRKNVLNLIDAFLQLPASLRKEYQLVIAGRIGWNCDKEVAKFKEIEDTDSNIVHLGYITNEAKSILYQSATIFSSASHYEGFGMPILEAMSYGTPCVISNIPVFKEVAGTAASYFNQDTPVSIAAAYETVLQNPEIRQRLSDQALARVRLFNWDNVAASVHDMIIRQIDKPNI